MRSRSELGVTFQHQRRFPVTNRLRADPSLREEPLRNPHAPAVQVGSIRSGTEKPRPAEREAKAPRDRSREPVVLQSIAEPVEPVPALRTFQATGKSTRFRGEGDE